MEAISRDVLSSDIWEMYQNDQYLKSYNYNYDGDGNNQIHDGGQDMYDDGNRVSTTSLYNISNLFVIFPIIRNIFIKGIIFCGFFFRRKHCVWQPLQVYFVNTFCDFILKEFFIYTVVRLNYFLR